MKATLSAVVIFLIAMFFVSSCSDTPNLNAPDQTFQTDTTCALGTTYPLIAGQFDTVGTIHVSNDATNIYITYTITDPECTEGLQNLHVWVGSDLTNTDNGGECRPAPGKLCNLNGGACADANGAMTYTITIPFTDLAIQDVNEVCGLQLYVVAHAEACGETAFGGNVPGPEICSGAWWFYATYIVCCENGNPPTPSCETAFAKGGWVWTTSPKANPENLPSLNLIRNRWGWAINLLAPGTTTYNIWAGAGLNKIQNGTLVGTLTIVWDGTTATVTYNLTSGCVMEEVHLYAADGRPTTTAPGLYGNTASFDPGVSTYTFVVPLEDTNNTDGVWLIAHAVVCCN